jgi:L-alanine-DL-glutamate epimerase-like enolase superfamily enzyme
MSRTAGNHIGRRDFIRRLAGAAALAGVTSPFDHARAAISPGEKGIYITNIYRTKVTDWSYSGGHIVRIETNKGITGYGECRDVDSQAQTWLNTLSPYLVGRNPTRIEDIYNTLLRRWTPLPVSNMKGQEKNGTGAISGLEIACWDIVGKVYNVPVHKLLGNKLRDKIPLYADTDGNSASNVESRVAKGFKYFKCDMYLDNIARSNHTHASTPNRYGYREITINQAGLDQMHAYMDTYRNTLRQFGEPYASAPISSDHYQNYASNDQLSVESAVALANDLKSHNGAGWMEDIIDWWIDGFSGAPLKEVIDATSADTIICTGEDMLGFDQFKKFADLGAVRMIHPEPNTAGGLNQTSLACRYAATKGIKTAFHNSSGPIAMTAYAHLAATLPDFVALEYHNMNTSWHDTLIDGIDKPMIQDGMMNVPEGPGFGFTPNAAALSAHGAGTWTKIV